MTVKKQKFEERKERFRTGGGPPPPSKSPSGDDIAAWLPHEFTVDSNQFDSDNQVHRIHSFLINTNSKANKNVNYWVSDFASGRGLPPS